MKKYNIAIAGATGAVGVEILSIIKERNFPVNDIKLLASKSSKGKVIKFDGKDIIVEELCSDSFEDIDIAFFSAGGIISKKFVPDAVKAGAVVIDNSSAFRMDSDVPLVVPEVNPNDIKNHKGIIANPNCTTIVMLVALKPLHDIFTAKKVIVSSYQSASGAGAKGLNELKKQAEEYPNISFKNEVFEHQLLLNVIPQIGDIKNTGYTTEEEKMYFETKKMLSKDIDVTATCVRVPVATCHSESVTVLFEKEVSLEVAKNALLNASGVKYIEDDLPMPLLLTGTDDCYVGRLRKDRAFENALSFWVVGDQLRKGAALNAVQIAEYLIGSD